MRQSLTVRGRSAKSRGAWASAWDGAMTTYWMEGDDASLLSSFWIAGGDGFIHPDTLPGSGDTLNGPIGMEKGTLNVDRLVRYNGMISLPPTIYGGKVTANWGEAVNAGGMGFTATVTINGTIDISASAKAHGTIKAQTIDGDASASDGGQVIVGGQIKGTAHVAGVGSLIRAGDVLGSVSVLDSELECAAIRVSGEDQECSLFVTHGSVTASSVSFNSRSSTNTFHGSVIHVTGGTLDVAGNFVINTWTKPADSFLVATEDGEMTVGGSMTLGKFRDQLDTVTFEEHATFECAGTFTIGETGIGAVHIEDSAEVTVGKLIMGVTARSGNFSLPNLLRVVDGDFEQPKATLHTQSIDVGVKGSAYVEVKLGALMTSTSARLGVAAGSSGTVFVSDVAGPGDFYSQWRVSGNITVGDNGLGLLSIYAGGLVTARDIFVAQQERSGTKDNPSTILVGDGRLKAQDLTVGKEGFGFVWVEGDDGDEGRLDITTMSIGINGKMTTTRDGVAIVRKGIVIDAEIEATAQLSTDYAGSIVVGAGTIANTPNGMIDIASAGYIRGHGMIFTPTLRVNGVLEAQGGILQVHGNGVSGGGIAEIDSNATLRCDKITNLDVAFGGTRATFILDAPSAYGGIIDGFAFSDAIVLIGKHVDSYRWTHAGAWLELTNSDSTKITYKFAGAVNAKLSLSYEGGDTTITITKGQGTGAGERLDGSDQNDQIVALGGNDTIVGFLGQDVMTGGIGNDIFGYEALADTGKTAATRDRITDFDAGTAATFVDRIDLRDIDARTGAGNQAFDFIGAAAFDDGVKGQLRISHLGGNTVISGDVNGDAVADFQIELEGNIAFAKFSDIDFLL